MKPNKKTYIVLGLMVGVGMLGVAGFSLLSIRSETPKSPNPVISESSHSSQWLDSADERFSRVQRYAGLSRREVQRIVEERNRSVKEHQKVFLEHGWRAANKVVPDPQLMSLDPSLVGSRDNALLRQIITNSIHDDQIDNAIQIALTTSSSRLRHEVIRALGRRHTSQAQAALRQLAQADFSTEDKQMIIGMLPLQ